MNKIKESKLLSFIVIAIIYILATILQVVLFNKLAIDNLYLKILIIDVLATVFVFIFSLIFNNASIYDPYWSVEPLIILILLMSQNKINYPVVISFGIVAIIWSLRLTLNWALSFNNLTKQDWRYNMLKEKTKKFYPLVNFFGIHLFPTIVVYLCMLPMIDFIKINFTNYFSYFGIVIMLIGLLFEILSDLDIYEYHKRNKDDRRQILQTGLWKYSRHPNYFGEILFWYGVFVSLFPVDPSCWYFVIGAIVNNLMFIFISIPMQENRLKTYKFNYEKYQEETRMLIPIKK